MLKIIEDLREFLLCGLYLLLITVLEIKTKKIENYVIILKYIHFNIYLISLTLRRPEFITLIYSGI